MRSEARHIPSQEHSHSDKQRTRSPERLLHVVRSTETQNKQTDRDEVQQQRANIHAYLDTQSVQEDPEIASAFPTHDQASRDVSHAEDALRLAKTNLAWAKDGLKEIEAELREEQQLPEKRSDEIRKELEQLERISPENDPDVDDLRAELLEAEEEEQSEGYIGFLEEAEESYRDALNEVAECTAAVERAQVELLTCQRILRHVQKQSPPRADLWMRIKNILSRLKSKKKQGVIESEEEEEDIPLKEAA